MKNYVELLNIEEVKKIIQIIVTYGDVKDLKIENIKFENKIYSIEKDRDNVYIKCSDGRGLNVGLNFEYNNCHDGYEYKWIERLVYANIQYVLPTNEFFTYNNKISRESVKSKKKTYDGLDNISIDDIVCGLIGAFTDNQGNTRNYFNFDFSNFDYKKSTFGPLFKFKNDGIAYGNSILVSKDGNNILSIDSSPLDIEVTGIDYKGRDLSLDIVKTFSLEKEVKNIELLLEENKYNFHPFTINLLKEIIVKLVHEDVINEDLINKYNNIIPECKKIIDSRNYYIDSLNKYKYNKNELIFLIDVLKKDVSQVKKDRESEKVKKLVKSLSPSEMDALRDYLG